LTAVLPSLTTDKYTCQPVPATPPHTHTTAQPHFHTVYAIEEQWSQSMLCLRCRIASRGRIEIQLPAWSVTCCTAPTACNGVVVHLHCYSTQVPAFTVRVYRMYCSRARQRSEIHRNTTPASPSPGSCSVILWLMCDHSLSVHTQSMLRGNTVADLAGSCPEASATPVHI
jgi:hypothetical protein